MPLELAPRPPDWTSEPSLSESAVSLAMASCSALGARVQPVEPEQHAGLGEGIVVLRHLGDEVGRGHEIRPSLLVRLRDHQHHEAHRPCLLRVCKVGAGPTPAPLWRRTRTPEIDTGLTAAPKGTRRACQSTGPSRPGAHPAAQPTRKKA